MKVAGNLFGCKTDVLIKQPSFERVKNIECPHTKTTGTF